jgi:hypothetical protein
LFFGLLKDFMTLVGKLDGVAFMNAVNNELGSMHAFTWKD